MGTNYKISKSVWIPIACLILSVLIAAGFYGCGSSSTDSKGTPDGSLVGTSGCISFLDVARRSLVPPCCTGIEYSYDIDTRVLSVTHRGAGFNCCTDVSANIEIDGDQITIEETESGQYCFCLCLFDLDFELTSISMAEYTIRIDELYLQEGDTPLELTIDLSQTLSGSYVVERNHYPWDES